MPRRSGDSVTEAGSKRFGTANPEIGKGKDGGGGRRGARKNPIIFINGSRIYFY